MIEVVLLSFELLTIVGGLYQIHHRKIKFDIALLLLLIYESIVHYGIANLGFASNLLLSTYVVIYIFSLYAFKENLLITLIGEIIAILLTGISQLIFYIPVSIIIGDLHQDKLIICIVNGLCFLFVGLCGSKLRLYNILEYIKQKNILTYISFAVIIFYISIQIYNLRKTHYWDEMHFAEVLIWLLLIFILWMQCQKNRMEVARKKIQLEKQDEYVQSFEEHLNRVRFKQHDIKNHLSAFQGMAEETNDYNELMSLQKQYSDYLLQDEDYKRLVKGGNPIVTGFLNKKIQEMQSKDIDFRYEISYIELEKGLSMYEWIDVMGILLDNAMEAVVNQSEDQKRIYMELLQDDKQIELKVSNVSRYIGSEESTEFFQVGYSSKGKNRGIGLAKVKELVLKRNGTIYVRNIMKDNNNWIEFSICVKKGLSGNGQF